MSTKKIRHALLVLQRIARDPTSAGNIAAGEALAEVEAIERAARSLYDGSGLEVLRANDYDETPDLFERIAKESTP